MSAFPRSRGASPSRLARPFLVLAATAAAAGCTVSKFAIDVPEQGRAGLVAVHPSNADRMLVASATGGLFRTADRGESFEHVGSLPSYLVRAVAYSPHDPSLVIATTFARYRAGETGIWRSTNGGGSWAIPTGSRMPPGPRCPDVVMAHDIAFDPDDPGRVYVATDCGLAISVDAGATWSHTQLDPARPPGPPKLQNRVSALLALTGGRVLAAARDGIWRSDDAGQTWSRSAGDPATGSDGLLRAFAVSPFSERHVFLVHRSGGRSRLYLSGDGGASWTLEADFERGWARPLFVRVVRVPFFWPFVGVYFGDGVRVRTALYLDHDPPLRASDWTVLPEDHADPSDVAIHPNGRTALILTTDGGVHRLEDGVWRMTGNNGYDALQITEVTGQAVGGANPHQDLYFGTQDNRIQASADGGETWPGRICCEGFFLRIPPPAPASHAGMKVTGVKCGACSNFVADPHLASTSAWPDPDDGDALDDTDGNPFSLGFVGHYVQRAKNDDVAPVVHRFKLTRNMGGTWEDAYIVDPTPRGRPLVAGRSDDPTIYHAVRRPGLTTNGLARVGLVRVRGIYDDAGAAVTDADVSGLGSIGTFPTMFAQYTVFGVNPADPDQLMAADVEDEQMKFSHDGGQTWHPHEQLTGLVTAEGQFAFRERHFPIVTTIAFDPYDRCHLLVGTTQAGIFRSTDGGTSFSKVRSSEQVTNVSSFYFPPEGRVIVSTYGRGLWKLRLRRSDRSHCLEISIPGMQLVPYEWDLITGQRFPFRWPPDPGGGWCPACEYVLVKHGVITALERDGERLTGLTISGGYVYHFDRSGAERPLAIPNRYAIEPAHFEWPADLRRRIPAADLPRGRIRGLLLEDGVIRGLITSEDDLPVQPARVPYVEVASARSVGGYATVRPGDVLVVSGSGFEPTQGGAATLTILLDGAVLAENVPVSAGGVFRREVEVPPLEPGQHEVLVHQEAGLRTSRDRVTIVVVSGDGSEEG